MRVSALAGKIVEEYPTEPLSTNPTTKWTATDHPGSPRVVTDSDSAFFSAVDLALTELMFERIDLQRLRRFDDRQPFDRFGRDIHLCNEILLVLGVCFRRTEMNFEDFVFLERVDQFVIDLKRIDDPAAVTGIDAKMKRFNFFFFYLQAFRPSDGDEFVELGDCPLRS